MNIRETEENNVALDLDPPELDQVDEPKVVERTKRDRRKTKTIDDPVKRNKQLEQLNYSF